MPPKASIKASKATMTGGDGKQKPVFEADYASAREKRFSALRTHATLQFNYEGITRPSLLQCSQFNGNQHDDENGFDDLSQPQQTNNFSIDDQERLWVHPVETQDKGRILVSDMAFKPGDIIFRERPLAKASWHDFHCHECGQPHEYKKCRQFLGVYGKDSAISKNMMEIEDILAQFEIIGDLDRARLYIKLIWLWSQCPDASCWEELKKLTTAGTRQQDYLQCVAEFRNKLIVKKSQLIPDSFSDDHLATLLAVLNNNSHEIAGYGSGIWLYASLLEHSCSANTNFVTSEDELLLVAIADIPANTSLTIDYNVATYKPYKVRQEHYLSHYGFACTCTTCTVGFDKPRSFHCPQAMRYLSSFAHANGAQSIAMGQFDQPNSALTHLVDQNNNNIQRDIAAFRKAHLVSKFGESYQQNALTPAQQQQLHPIEPLYSFNSVQLSPSNCPFTTMAPNPTAKSSKCINGVVHPVGDGSNPLSWKCSGCEYTLTEAEVSICLEFESKIQPPPSVGQGDEYDDIYELFEMHNYQLPSLAQINSALSHGVIHISHSSIYWTLYVLALKWTKRATDSCYTLESTALKQKMNAQKKAKKAGKKAARGTGAGQAAHQITLALPEDSLSEDQLNAEEFQIRQRLGFFSSTYEPLTSSLEFHQKSKSDLNKAQKSDMGDEGNANSLLDFKVDSSTCVPSHIELPLLAEHLWTVIAESASSNLHPLHPELLIIFDYLAQIQILKKRIRRAKFIWSYNYHLSSIINSTISKETYKLKRLVTHTPRTISQLQHHYSTIEELYQKLAFHQEDASTTEILKQFTLTAIDSDSDDDMSSLVSAMAGGSGPTQGQAAQNGLEQQPTAAEDSDSDVDDADELLLRSQFGQNIIKTAQKHQTSEAKTHASHHQSGIVTSPNKDQIQAAVSSSPFSQGNSFSAFGNTSSSAPQSSNPFDMGLNTSPSASSASASTSANPFDTALSSSSAAPAGQFQNSFGFSSSVLFAPGSKTPTQPEEKKNVFGSAANFTVSSFGATVFSPTQPKDQKSQQPATSAFVGGGFGSLTGTNTPSSAFGSSGTAFGSSPSAFGSATFGSSPSAPKTGTNAFGSAQSGGPNGFAVFSAQKKEDGKQ